MPLLPNQYAVSNGLREGPRHLLLGRVGPFWMVPMAQRGYFTRRSMPTHCHNAGRGRPTKPSCSRCQCRRQLRGETDTGGDKEAAAGQYSCRTTAAAAAAVGEQAICRRSPGAFTACPALAQQPGPAAAIPQRRVATWRAATGWLAHSTGLPASGGIQPRGSPRCALPS